MKYLDIDVVFQEVPNEVSLSLGITGCPNRCKGCHTPEYQDGSNGEVLTDGIFKYHLKKNKGITCVLFYGGEWEEDRLLELISIAKKEGLKVCLYTGNESIGETLFNQLDYLKTGPYVEKLGALNSKTTNQVFINTKTGENLNHYFLKD